MPSTLLLTVCVVLAIFSISAPCSVHAESNLQATQRLTHPDTLTIHLDRSSGNNMKGAAKAASGSKAYQRLLRAQSHGARVNTERAKKEMHTMSSTSTAPLAGCPFSDLTVPITIGHNTNRTYALIIDTGSATLALAGSSCSTCSGVTPEWIASSSSSDTHTSANGLYGDHTGWAGDIWSDRVAIGGGAGGKNVSAYATTRIVVISQQSTEGFDASGQADKDAKPFFITNPCADATPSQKNQIFSQGIVGMGFQALAQQNTDSFIANFFTQNPTVPTIFALQLCEYSGRLWLGGSDESTYVGQPIWMPIINQAYWEVAPADVYVDGVSLGLVPSSWTSGLSNYNIVDSGTSLLELPMPIYNAIVAMIIANPAFQKYFRSSPTNNFFQQPTSNCEYPTTAVPLGTWEHLQQVLPTITITFTNGLQLTMDGVGSYLLPCTNSYDQFTPGIVGVDNTRMIAGWSLMNQFVTFHDMTNAQIGFAPSRGCTTGQVPLRANVTMGASIPGGGSDTSTGLNAGTSVAPVDSLYFITLLLSLFLFRSFGR